MMPSKLDAAAALESMDSMDALQSKPLTTVPDEMRPAFDYSGLDAQTVDDLHFAEKEYQHGKKLAERGLVHMGNAIAAAHDALCGTVVQQLDNGEDGACRTMRKARNNQHSEDTFKSWCLSIGITKDSAYRLLQVSALMDNSSPRQQKVLKELSPTLLYAVAKPSTPAVLFVGRYDGPVQPASLLNRTYRGRQLYGPILCYGWKGNNIQPMSKDVQAEMLDRLKDTEVRV